MTAAEDSLKLDLQLFADGAGDGAAAAGNAGTAEPGVTAADAGLQNGRKADRFANVVFGKQPAAQDAAAQDQAGEPAQPQDRRAQMMALLKGEYEAEFKAYMQDTVQKRVGKLQGELEERRKSDPLLDRLYQRYNVNRGDVAALERAIDQDTAYLEDEAMELGEDVDRLKYVKDLERKVQTYEMQAHEREEQIEMDRNFARWTAQAEAAKASFPGLDLAAELQNPQFFRMLMNGIDVGNAYLAMHSREIMPAVMQYTARDAQQKTAAAIAAGAGRPRENGATGSGAPVIRSDPRTFTKEERAEIRRRVNAGERIEL